LPDDRTASGHVSLRVPNDLIAAYDKLAAALDRPRSWVILRALRQYLEDEGEGAELFEDLESLTELDRGEMAPFEETLRRVEQIIANAAKARASQKITTRIAYSPMRVFSPPRGAVVTGWGQAASSSFSSVGFGPES
jgi:predicted transcriptional regulator